MKRTVRLRAGVVAAWLALLMSLAATATAAPGDLDPTFREQGKFTGGSAAEAVAVQADGKVLVLGTHSIRRLKTNGRDDKPFGLGRDDAITRNPIPLGYSGPGSADLVLQPDGKIVIVGFVDESDGSATFTVARLTTDGEFDPSFGSGGSATLPLEGTGGVDDFGPRPRIALQGDGSIVVGGQMSDMAQVGRLTSAGLPDPTLGGDGSVVVDLGPGVALRDIAPAAGGKILVAGSPDTGLGTPSDFTVARLDPNGTLDPTFAGDGTQSADLGGHDVVAGLAVQGDGMIVAGGTSYTSCPGSLCRSRFGLARLDPTGVLDPLFGSLGTVTTLPPGGIDGTAADVALQSDGRIVLAGGGNDFLLARYDSAGMLDPGFGTNGLTWTPFLGSYPAYGNALALGPDDRAVVAGLVYLEKFYDELTIARYEVADGPQDLDGDEVTDSSDECPRAFGTHPTGCPVIKRILKLKYDRDSGKVFDKTQVRQISGEPLAGYRQSTALECLDAGGQVTLYEKRPGRDRRVDRDPAGALRFRVRGKGTFYARVGAEIVTVFAPDGPVELCRAARSRPLEID